MSYVREAPGDVECLQTFQTGLAPISPLLSKAQPGALLSLGPSLPKEVITPRTISSPLGAVIIAVFCAYPDYQENTASADVLTKDETQRQLISDVRAVLRWSTRGGHCALASQAERHLGVGYGVIESPPLWPPAAAWVTYGDG
jgi:hypothetical protein